MEDTKAPPDVDRRGRRLGLDPKARTERARKAARAAHSVSAYVRRIVENAPDLTEADIAALRQIIYPPQHSTIYLSGMNAGLSLAAERIAAARVEVA